MNYKLIRRQLKDKDVKSKIIVDKIYNLDEYKKASCIALYSPLADEVNIKEIIVKGLEEGKKIVLPKVISSKEMILVEVKDIEELEYFGNFGVLEPKNNESIDKNDVELMIVPGISFDERGYRIGYGKGFFDKFLKDCNNVFTVGVCFKECFMKENIDNSEYDIPCDIVIHD